MTEAWMGKRARPNSRRVAASQPQLSQRESTLVNFGEVVLALLNGGLIDAETLAQIRLAASTRSLIAPTPKKLKDTVEPHQAETIEDAAGDVHACDAPTDFDDDED